MPSLYAHHSFGKEIYKKLPEISSKSSENTLTLLMPDSRDLISYSSIVPLSNAAPTNWVAPSTASLFVIFWREYAR